jgi:hypothetical protein
MEVMRSEVSDLKSQFKITDIHSLTSNLGLCALRRNAKIIIDETAWPV